MLLLVALLIGCGSPPGDEPSGDEPSGAASSTGSMGSSGSTGATPDPGTEEDSSSSGQPPACTPDLSRAPELVQSRIAEWIGFHAAGGYGAFYLAGPVSGDDDDSDVQLSRIDETGAELWTAQWGSALGWIDTPSGLHAVPEGVVVSGVSGLYPSQEYPLTGTSFLRGYSPGGQVLWTWEDASPSFAVIFSRRDGPVVSIGGQSVAVLAPVLQQDTRVGLRFVLLDRSDGTERARAEWDAPSAEPHAAWTDEDGSVWAAATTMQGFVLLRWDGTGEPTTEVAAGEPLFRHAFFYPDGTLLALASAFAGGEDRLHLRRYSRSLELQQETVLEVDGFRRQDLFEMSATFGCDDVALIVGLWSQGAPVIAVNAALEEMWTVRGLGSVALGQDGDLIVAGYDESLEASAIRQLRFP